VKLGSGELTVDGVQVRLTPGMNLSAEIRIGHRRVIDYLLSPLQRHAAESLREQ
jgi:hemolysin D